MHCNSLLESMPPKIIQNLEFVNSFRLSALALFLFWFFHFCNLGPVQTGRPPPGKGRGWESESFRVFNTRQESGNGTRVAENWVPIGASIWDPDPRLGSRSSGGSYLEIGGRARLGRLRPGRGVEVPQVATSAALRAGARR